MQLRDIFQQERYRVIRKLGNGAANRLAGARQRVSRSQSSPWGNRPRDSRLTVTKHSTLRGRESGKGPIE